MSPGRRNKGDAKKPSPPVTGSGPDGRVEIGDIREKLEEIRGEVSDTTDSVRPYLTYAAVAGAVVLVAVAFLAGRRRGRRKSTWVEIKRL
jgi:hypothetical protein